MAIPLYYLDEHHQAFLAWWDALGTSNFTSRHLIHVDEHADFGVPILSERMPQRDALLGEIKTFTYRQLSVGTFLIPAHHFRFFSRLSWMRPRNMVRSRLEGFKVIDEPNPPWITIHCTNSDEGPLIYEQGDWSIQIEEGQPWLLDICLDAFACEETPRAIDLKLEITQEQYELLSRLSLDPWHARYGASVRLFQREGRFEFSLCEPDPGNRLNDSARLEDASKRLFGLREWLLEQKTVPQVITLARSVSSGYTPAGLAEALESAVISMLKEIYPLIHIRILP